MNLETKITIYKFTPQLFTLTPQDFAMSEFSLTLVLRKEDKQNSNMTWQRYK